MHDLKQNKMAGVKSIITLTLNGFLVQMYLAIIIYLSEIVLSETDAKKLLRRNQGIQRCGDIS